MSLSLYMIYIYIYTHIYVYSIASEGPVYPGSDESVDITALACRVQGDVWSADCYWSLLAFGGDTPSPVPLSRWDHELYYSEQQEPGKGYVRHFGFLDHEQLASFDNEFFGISEEEATRVDPCQRVGVEVGYDCLFRAGWDRKSTRNAEIAYVAAYAGSEWISSARNGVYGGGPGAFLVEQNTPAACAMRLHYLLNMRGPCATVETACSSSLTATAMVHCHLRPPTMGMLASSMRPQVNCGLTGAMNAYFDPFYTIGLCGASMLTHTGRCFTFDASADGFIRGEGFTAMHYRVNRGEDLARLAMLCGSHMNQDGRSASLTAPHGPSQQQCIRHSLSEAGIKSSQLQIQELHGTGTPLGDPIEIGALRATMMMYEGEVREDPLIKTSSKSNIGHTELNAGNCGIMKCVLMGLYCAAAPNLHLRLLNPHVDSNGYPVYFNSEFVEQGKERAGRPSSAFFSIAVPLVMFPLLFTFLCVFFLPQAWARNRIPKHLFPAGIGPFHGKSSYSDHARANSFQTCAYGQQHRSNIGRRDGCSVRALGLCPIDLHPVCFLRPGRTACSGPPASQKTKFQDPILPDTYWSQYFFHVWKGFA